MSFRLGCWVGEGVLRSMEHTRSLKSCFVREEINYDDLYNIEYEYIKSYDYIKNKVTPCSNFQRGVWNPRSQEVRSFVLSSF